MWNLKAGQCTAECICSCGPCSAGRGGVVDCIVTSHLAVAWRCQHLHLTRLLHSKYTHHEAGRRWVPRRVCIGTRCWKAPLHFWPGPFTFGMMLLPFLDGEWHLRLPFAAMGRLWCPAGPRCGRLPVASVCCCCLSVTMHRRLCCSRCAFTRGGSSTWRRHVWHAAALCET